MVTKAQALIIKRVCEIQFSSLEDIFVTTSLGKENEQLMEALDISRNDFDKTILDTWKGFQELHDKPEKLFELGYYELVVFLFILTNLRDKYGKKYPNAINTLGKKVLALLEPSKFLN